jgi:hypothetical protein
MRPGARTTWDPTKVRIIGLLGLLLAIGCGGPLGPFAGGALSGPPGPAEVDDWTFAAGLLTAQLETNPDDPRSVTIWFATIGPHVYISSSLILGQSQPSERGWVKGVMQDPRVRIRIDGAVYERVAVRVENASEYAVALQALEVKYGLDPAERDPDRVVWIFRLDPRSC